MKHLCEYGCGQEAKFQFKNGKWCCSKNATQCSNQRKSNSLRIKKAYKDPTNKYNSGEYKEKISISMKKVWADPNSVFNSDKYKKNQKEIGNSVEFKEIQRKATQERWDDPNSYVNSKEFKENLLKSLNTPEYKEKKSKSLKEAWKDPNSKLNSKERSEKISKNSKAMWADPNSIFNSNEFKEKVSKSLKEVWKDPNSIFNSKIYRENLSVGSKITIEQIKERYSTFYKEEEMRYDPYIIGVNKIQFHCKNHNCPNSKEKNGWFTPNRGQLIRRIDALERYYGNDGAYFYCSQHCKDTCILFNLRSDPLKENNLPYTPAEKEIWRQIVLELDKGICQFCGKKATDVHHIKPVKTHPHLSLDLDNGISFCEECHYKIGHPKGSECSTGNLAKITCNTESQKFLNQQINKE